MCWRKQKKWVEKCRSWCVSDIHEGCTKNSIDDADVVVVDDHDDDDDDDEDDEDDEIIIGFG